MSQIDLQRKFPWMTPIKAAPTLHRVNGCGVGLYGRRDADAETASYVATWCVSILFVPVLCLRAYRVAPAQRGWYFLGREPLSPLAKAWNVVVPLIVAGAIGAISWTAYTGTPSYKARQQMAAAQRLTSQGHLAQAAAIYQTVALAGADEADRAAQSLKDLVNSGCAQAPLSECPGVLTAAIQVSRRNHAIPLGAIIAKGLELSAANGASDPRAALGVLDAIRPLAVDTRPIDDARLPLLRQLVAADPSNTDTVCALASLLEQQDQIDQAKKLLLPIKDRLGTGEGAKALGRILMREGDYNGAYALLWPYVQTRLARLHAAEKAADDTMKQLWDREFQLLKNEKAPQDFYREYDATPKDKQAALVRKYIDGRIKNDPQLVSTQNDLERESTVVPVTLDLGIVMLHRAQDQTDPGARKKQLEAAEQVFLAIRGLAGESDEYRLHLGQVYYWLGKQTEGRKLFDELIAAKNRDYGVLFGIAQRLRYVGAETEARALAEEAYSKASKDEERDQAANLRAVCCKDNDDEITWLTKCNSANATIKAELAMAVGNKAYQEGRDGDAADQYRAALDAYNTMPRNDFTLNETALAYSALFGVTGDHEALDHSVDYFQQAVNLKPDDSILLLNAGTTVLEASLADVIGKDIDLRALHQSGSVDLLRYLYADQRARDALVQRIKDHPGVGRALSYLEKAVVLMPRNLAPYDLIYELHAFTHNTEALGTLEQRLKAANPDTSDQFTHQKEFLSGSKDAQNRAHLTASLKRSEDLCHKLLARAGSTAAIALNQQTAAMEALDAYTDSVAPDKVVKLAEDAYQLCPSAGTSGALQSARMFRAAKELVRSDPAFAALSKKYRRSVGTGWVLAIALDQPGALRDKVLAHPDIQRVLATMTEDRKRFPSGGSPYDWVFLKNADAAVADELAQTLRKDPRYLVEHSIGSLLAPASAGEALSTNWLMQILGRPDDGRAALRKVADTGIPVPMQP